MTSLLCRQAAISVAPVTGLRQAGGEPGPEQDSRNQVYSFFARRARIHACMRS